MASGHGRNKNDYAREMRGAALQERFDGILCEKGVSGTHSNNTSPPLRHDLTARYKASFLTVCREAKATQPKGRALQALQRTGCWQRRILVFMKWLHIDSVKGL